MRRVSLLLFGALAGTAAVGAQVPPRVPIIAGEMHVRVIVDVDGTVRSWGSPLDAEGPYLGDGSDGRASRDELAPVPGMHDIVGVAVGYQHVLLLSNDGTVMAWGIWANGKAPAEWVLKPIPIFTVTLRD